MITTQAIAAGASATALVLAAFIRSDRRHRHGHGHYITSATTSDMTSARDAMAAWARGREDDQ